LNNNERDFTEVDRQTIEDFGNQWTRFDELSDNICSRAQLVDHCGPVFDIDELKGARVLDIGSGSGCVVKMLIDAEAQHVTAVEPSKAMLSCKANTAAFKERIDYVQVTGDKAPLGNFDAAISLGVIHHIKRPDGVMRRVAHALKPGGAFIVWVYGYEGNEIYLAIMDHLRKVTQRLPDTVLNVLCYVFAVALSLYTFISKALPLPMARYMREVIARQTFRERILTIFDQLNPAYAKYYRRNEILQLFKTNGFCDIQYYHRHGYSWTVVGRRPSKRMEL
jgi:2-polyprenyl-3-methyl-5-hydroxy-6-metoxy-1,4-benzoquinol methylase